MAILLGVLGGLAIAAALHYGQKWRNRPRPSVVEEVCVLCAQDGDLTPISGRQVHEVVTRPRDDIERDLASWGGTYTAICYCRAHCPGECSNPRCHRRAKLAA